MTVRISQLAQRGCRMAFAFPRVCAPGVAVSACGGLFSGSQ
jgi:hypothetical protein